MNNTCGKCGGYVGDFIYSGTGAVICNCTPSHKEEKCACHEQTTFGDADVEIGGICHRTKAPCYIIDSTEEWEKEFDEEYDGCCLGSTQGTSDANKKDIKTFISQSRKEAQREVLRDILNMDLCGYVRDLVDDYAKEKGIEL